MRYTIHLSDLYLHNLVKSPVNIELGGKATLMVNRSAAGEMFWTHNGELIRYDGSHYTIFSVQDLGHREVGLEIHDATAEQAGYYEAILFKGSCDVRNTIQVQVEGEHCFDYYFCSYKPKVGETADLISRLLCRRH